MVEEKFKIGLEVELDQKSLDSIAKQVQKKIQQALLEGSRKALQGGGSGAIRSAQAAASVNPNTLGKAIQKGLATEGTRANKEVVRAVKELTTEIRRGRSAGGGGDLGRQRALQEVGRRVGSLRARAQQGPLDAGESRDLQRQLRKLEKIITQGSRLRERAQQVTRRLEQSEEKLAKANEKLAAERERAARQTRRVGVGPSGAFVSGPRGRNLVSEKQQGATNVRIGANIDTRRAAGSQRTAGGGAGSKAALLGDAPSQKTGLQAGASVKERKAVRSNKADYASGANLIANSVAKSLGELKKALSVVAPQATADPNFFKRVGLAGKVGVGPGSSATVTQQGREARHVSAVIKLLGDRLDSLSDVVSEKVREIMGSGKIEAMGRLGRRDPKAFEHQVSRMANDLFQGLAPVKTRQPLRPFQKGGEAQVVVKVDAELQKRLSRLETETEVLAELNRVLAEAPKKYAKLGEALRRVGIDVMTTTGLTEETATKLSIIRGEAPQGKKGPIEEIRVPMQTRALGQIGPGGAGAIKPQRMFQPFQIGQLVGGTNPAVMGRGEKELYGSGTLGGGAYKQVKTALLDAGMVPELYEDQALIDPNKVKMQMKEVRTIMVRDLSGGIEEGVKLARGQILGTIGEGEDLKQIAYALKGSEGTVNKIEKMTQDGIEGYRIVVEELKDTVTGMKITERGGIKGMARAEPGFAKRLGLPEDVGAAISTRAVAARGSVRTIVEMMANNMSEATGKGASIISDAIFEAMGEGSKDFYEAGMEVAKRLGLVEIPGVVELTKGPLAKAAGGKARVFTGNVAMGRLTNEGQKGPMNIGPRYVSAPGIQALKTQASTEGFAQELVENMGNVTEGFEELRRTAASLDPEIENIKENLETLFPEQIKRLPAGAAKNAQELMGTLLDPKLQKAFQLALPTKGGGSEMLRVPAMGAGLGARGSFSTKLGGTGFGSITKMLDRIAEQGEKARAAMGMVELEEGSEGFAEAAEVTSKAMRAQIAQIVKLGVTTKEGAAAAQTFVDSFMPLVESLGSGSAGIAFKGRGGKVVETQRSAADYVKFLDEGKQKTRDMQGQLFAIGDLLAERGTGPQGTNIPRLGAVHENAQILNKSMELLGVTLGQDSEAAEKALVQLEKLKENLRALLADSALKRSKPQQSSQASVAFGREAGVGIGPIGTVLEFATDARPALEAVGKALADLGKQGYDVAESMGALERTKALQGTLGGVDKDAVLINEEDLNSWAADIAKRRGTSLEEAKKKITGQPVMSLRYPITGQRSFVPVKVQVVGSDVLPAGQIGVGGPHAVSSPKDLEKMLAPLRGQREQSVERLRELSAAGKASSNEAQTLRNKLNQLTEIIERATPMFKHAGQNMDIDGDKAALMAIELTHGAEAVRTFTEQTARGAASTRGIWASTFGGALSKGGHGGVKELEEYFGKVVKGRPAELQRGVVRPVTAGYRAEQAAAHVAGKQSVGLLSDMFNKMLIAVTAGTHEMGEAFETAIGAMMLGINESLAQKHGTGGATGPAQFIKALQKGDMGSIMEGLESGEGFLGQLGGMWENITSELKTRMHGLDPKGLAEFAKMEGLEEAFQEEFKKTGGDLSKTVDKLVSELSLPKIMGRMFEMMKDNMKSAIKTLGMSPAQGQDLMAQVGKKGIDTKLIMEAVTPGFGSGRKSTYDEIAKLPALKRLRIAMSLIPEVVGKELVNSIDDADFSEGADPRKVATNLANKLSTWFESIQDQFVTKSEAQMAAEAGRPAGAKGPIGKFRRGTATRLGFEGEMALSGEKLGGFREALSVLKLFGAGDTMPSAGELSEAGQALRVFARLFAHEGVHKYLKRFPEFVEEISRNLLTAGGEFSEFANSVWKILLGKVEGAPGIGNVMKTHGRFQELKAQKAAGATTGGGLARVQSDAGLWKTVVRDMPIDQAMKSWATELTRVASEELVAYMTDPNIASAKGFEQMPDQVKGFLSNILGRLRQLAPEVIGAAMDVAEGLDSAYVDGLAEHGAKGGAQARKVAGARSEALLGDYPGKERQFSALSLLENMQQALMEGVTTFRLPKPQLTEEGRLAYDEPVREISQAGDFPEAARKIAKLMEAARQGLDPEALDAATKEVESLAGGVRRGMSSRKMKGGHQVYVDTIREFQTQAATGLINQARTIQGEISELKRTGKVDSPKFTGLIAELEKQVVQIYDYYVSTLRKRGRGKGTMATFLGTPKGELLPAARQMGIQPSKEMYEQMLSGVAGRGKEGASFLERLRKPIEESYELLLEGEDPLRVWNRLFHQMAEYPETIRADLNKVREILGSIIRMAGVTEGPLSEPIQNMEEVARMVGKAGDAMRGRKVGTTEDVLAAATGGTKQQRQSFAAGMGIEEQYADIQKVAKAEQEKLTKLIQNPEYQKLGAAGKHFEPITKEIIDPETGRVIQKFTIDFKKMGNTIKTSLTQIGAPAKAFGNQMRNAARRVVQWGFASGAIYGTIRAFRNLVQVVTEVQTKVANLMKVMDTSITNFEEMQNAASGMGKEFGIAIEDVLEGMVVYAQQGLKVNEIMDRTRSTMLAVNVTTLSSTEATEALTAAHKVFGSAMSNSTGFVDAWAAVAAKHAITAKDLAMAVQRSGAAAKTAGVSFEDFMGITTAIGAVTRQTGKEIATGTKFMFRAMRRPTAQKTLLGLGIQSQTGGGELKPAVDILGELAGRWGKLSRAQQLNTAQAMAGIRHYNQFIVLMENWREVINASADAQNSQGFAVRKNAIAVQTFAKQMQSLREHVKGVALDIGKLMLPGLTGITKLAKGAVAVLDLLPDSLKQLGVIGAASMITIHKGADMFVDTLDAIKGHGGDAQSSMKSLFQDRGLVRGAAALGKKGFGALFGGMGAAMRGKGEAAGERFGIIARGMLTAQKAASGLAKAFMGLSRAGKLLAGTTVVGLIASLGMLAYAYFDTAKSGKELEDELFDQIGRAKDSASALESQAKKIETVAIAWNKYEAAVETATDPGKLKEAIETGDYKSPLKALKDYSDTLAETGLAMAALDPSSIQGITESGDYITGISAGFSAMAVSAADAKKATAAALQVKVIQAYSDELNKAQGTWGKLLSYFGKDTDLTTQLKESRNLINGLSDRMEELSNLGISTVGIQQIRNQEIEKELSLREEMLVPATNLKRILEEMPIFNNLDMAQTLMGPKMRKSLEGAVGTGAFGRGATAGSVQMQYMARNLGLGGVLGYGGSAAPNMLQQSMLEQGLGGRTAGNLNLTQGGSFGVLSAKAAEGLLGLYHDLEAAGPQAETAVSAARTVLAGIDEATGDIFYYFDDAIRGGIQKIDQEGLNQILTDTLSNVVMYDRSKVEEVAERTRRLLTMQYVGVLAGIRDPGQFNIGPGRFRELSVEQRVMGNLPDELQRLADLQAELTQIQKTHNETLAEGVDVGPHAAGALQENINFLNRATEDLVKALQLEAFDLSQLAHMDSALQNLNKTMEDFATAARDAAIEEAARNELMRHTSGAMAGLAVVKNLDLGKAFKDLTAGERLQRTMGPGYTRALQAGATAERQREQGFQRVVAIRKQLADFNEMLQDLTTARGTLLGEQDASSTRRAQAALKGIDEGSQEVAAKVEDQTTQLISAADKQTSILERMLDHLKLSSEAEARGLEGRDKQQFFMDKMAGASIEELTSTLGAGGGASVMNKFFEQIVGGGAGALAVPDAWKGNLQDAVDNYMEAQAGLGTETMLGKKLETGGWQERLLQSVPGAAAGRKGKEAWVQDIKEAEQAILRIPGIVPLLERHVRLAISRKQKTEAEIKADESISKQQELMAQLARKRNEVFQRLGMAEKKAEAQTESAARAMQALEQFRLAEAAQGFVMGIESAIQDFEKAERLFYEKDKSDLEGPFARVGKPGFKTDFERRREELESKRFGGPRSLSDMKTENEELASIEFDEKEARLKQQQDKEVAALKLQQQQADTLRGKIEDALSGNALQGTGLEGSAQQYSNLLRDQLIESEQAQMRGGDLFFKGVPALEDARRFLQKIEEQTRKQAEKAQTEMLISANLAGNEPVVSELQKQTQIMTDTKSAIEAKTAGAIPRTGFGGQIQSFTPSGMIPKGTGPVDLSQYYHGPANTNQILDQQARHTSGNATARAGAVTSTEDVTGRRGTPGAPVPGGATRSPAEIGSTSSAELLGEMVGLLTELQSGVSTILEAGVPVGGDVVSSIDAVGISIVEALEDTLNVEISNTPLSVEVLDLETSFINAIDNSGLGAVGAEVADARLRLDVVESLVDPDGISVDERIDTAISDVEEQLSTLTGTTEVLSTNFEEFVAGFEELLTEQTEEVSAAVGQIAEFEENIAAIEATATEASTVALAAQASVTELTAALDVLRADTETRAQGLDADIRTLTTTLERNATADTQRDRRLDRLESLGESANSKAEQALNIARRPA